MRMLLFAIIVMAISKIHANFNFLTRLHPAQLAVLLALFYAMANPKSLATGKLLRTWPAKVMAGLGLMACLSVPFGLSMGGAAAFFLNEYSKTLVLAFLVLAAIRNTRDLYTMVWAYVAGTACLAYLAIFVLRTTVAAGDTMARISGGFSFDANDMCVIAVIGLPFALLCFQLSTGAARVFTVMTMLAVGMLVARSGSRGGFLGLVVVGGALLVLVRGISVHRKLLTVGVLAMGVFLSAPEGYLAQMQTILHPSEDYNTTSPTGRVEIWKRGFTYMITHPIAGIGVNNFQRAEGNISDQAVAAHEVDDGVRWNAAHSTIVQAGAEMGVPGLVLMVMLMYRGVFELLALRRKLPVSWEKGTPEERFLYQLTMFLPASLLGFGSAGLLVSHAYIEPIYLLGAFQAGYMTVLKEKLSGHSTGATAVPPPVRRYRGGLPPVGMPPNGR